MTRLTLLVAALSALAVCPALAAVLEVPAASVQGGLVRGLTEPGTRLTFDGRELRVSAEGRFAFGFGRDAVGPGVLEARFPDGRQMRRTIAVRPRSYPVERVEGLAPPMVTPPPEVLARIRRDNRLIGAVRSRDTAGTWFAETFAWPATGRVSGVYGSQRILNGEPRRPHYGLDVAAPEGSEVRAPAGGVVRLAEDDLYYTGGTLIIDHGHGVTSLFMHLSKLEAGAGQTVARGDLIGRVGATGRATGPHLDWRLNWFGVRLDPRLVVGDMPGQ